MSALTLYTHSVYVKRRLEDHIEIVKYEPCRIHNNYVSHDLILELNFEHTAYIIFAAFNEEYRALI